MRTNKSRNRNTKPAKRLAENENDPAQQQLVRYGSDYQRTNPVVGIARSPVPLCPAVMRVPVKYSSRLALVSSVGVYAEHNFAGNGLFDPDVTGTGTQPTGFDQWMAFYQKYRVLASHIRVQAINPTAATNAAAMTDLGVVPTNTVTAFANSDVAGSQPYAKRNLANLIGSGPNGFLRLSQSMESDLILGSSRETILSDETFSGSSSSNPANLWYWRIFQEPADVASTQTVVYEIEITYLTDFYERQLNSASATAPVARVLKRKPTA